MSGRILDRNFKYVPARVHQDSSDYLKAKFRRITRENKLAAEREKAALQKNLIVLKSERA